MILKWFREPPFAPVDACVEASLYVVRRTDGDLKRHQYSRLPMLFKTKEFAAGQAKAGETIVPIILVAGRE